MGNHQPSATPPKQSDGTAVNWDYVLNNPARGVKMPEGTRKRPHQFLTAEEVRQLVAASNEPLRTIIILATMSGLRIGEILALRWVRIDLLRGTLRVAETEAQLSQIGELRKYRGKRKSVGLVS